MFKVLIVEDDPMVARINEHYIVRNPMFSVVEKCRDGKSALDYLENEEADLVVLDVYMPHMDGFEVLRQIRKRQIPVEIIMVTAANDREALEEALHLGIVDYLVKPFTFERFQMALEKFIVQRKAFQDVDTLSQLNIDFILGGSRKKREEQYPKGIQEKTLQLITEYVKSQKGIWMTGDEIAAGTGLTGVTVRRYLNYLSEAGTVTSEMNYETGGRPSMRYRMDIS
ncbi:MAG: response regulator [Firmicutes bacterium]|nr:response regulator [Bacillota bacterium]